MNRNNRTYPAEFKQEAISYALGSPSIVQASEDLGIPEATLYNWVKKAKESGEQVIPDSGEMVNVGDLVKENLKLKQQLAKLEQEKAILKKAATYFAKELG